MIDRPAYFDIDGTLTAEPERGNGAPIPARLNQVRALLWAGQQVVIWSARGTAYAKAFVRKNNLAGAIAIGKPEFLVDDNPKIRPSSRMRIFSPESYFGE